MTTRSVLMYSGAAIAAIAAVAPANAQRRSFDIPAGSATKAIPEFARQAGIQIVAPGKMRNVRTNAVRGQLDVRTALGILLRGTGFGIVGEDASGLAIGPVPAISEIQPDGEGEEMAAAGTPPSEIVVTGSRIKRPGYDTLQPANAVSGDKSEKLGLNTAADAINQLPAFGTPTSGRGGQNAQTVGQNFVNAFGLGTGRTLTLINGRRVVSQASPGNSADPGLQVDLNIIPTVMVDRIETIYTGGAPIYGSDAIAGTVNVILKRQFKGLEIDAQNGITSRGDGRNYRIGVLAGADFAEGRGHIVFGGEYNREEGISGTARSRIANGYNYCANPNSRSATDGIPDQVICSNADAFSLVPLTGAPILTAGAFYGTNRTANAVLSNGDPLIFSLDGRSLITATQANLGTPISASAARGANPAANPYVIGPAETNSLVSPLTRKVATAVASYEISSAVTIYGEGLFAHSRSIDQYNQGGFSSSLFPAIGGPIRVRLDNPFLSDAQRATIAAANPAGLDTDGDGRADTPGFYVARYNDDILQGAPTSRSQRVYRLVGGLKGSFDAFGSSWNWDASYNYGRTRSVSRGRTINLTRFGLAADTLTNGAGQVVCRATANPAAASGTGAAVATPVTAADLAGCVPFNPFGYATSPDMDALRGYLLQDVRQVSILEQQVAEATISGSPVLLPAGQMSIAAGVTYRREAARYSGTQQNSGYFVGGVAGPISGHFDTKEAYAETVIPILSRAEDFSLPLVASLQLEGAARLVDNSYTGKAWTWTAGGRLGLHLPLVGNAFTVRGNVTHAVRAPSFSELLTPTSSTTGIGNDPCDPRFINSGASPANRASSCAAEVAQLKAAGSLPAGFALSDFTSSVVNVTVPGTSTGNAGLGNERSKSWTVGLLFAPENIPGLRASVDWTDIRIENAIVSTTLTQLFATCYDNGAFGSNDACSRFTRNPTTFQVTDFQLGFINAAQRRFSGLLADVQYRFPLEGIGLPGAVTVGATGFYTDRNEQRINRGDLDILAGERGFEKYKGQANFQYAVGGFSALWQVLYTSSGKIDAQARKELRDPGTFGAFWQHDLGIAMDVGPRISLRFTITDLFDAMDDAKRIAAKTTNAVIGGANLYSNLIGRSFTVGAKVKL